MGETELKTITFAVKGMHCPACELLTESELKENPCVLNVKASLASSSVTLTGNFGDRDAESIAAELSPMLEKHGYALSTRPENVTVNWKEFQVALPIAVAFIIAFVLLQKFGIVNLINSDTLSYGTAAFIGIIASLSTCMAVVGGLVLSMSATFAQSGQRVRPQLLFHLGRIISFFVLGGVIGALGASFSLGVTGIFILSALIGLVMIGLGLNLLDVFPWARRLTPTLPKFLSRPALGVAKLNHILTPALLGIVTFFLPCGFTQSMQLYALSSGSFINGALTMLAFALGTLPVLALVSFSSLSIGKSLKAGIFFKAAGIIVMLFGLFNILNSLAAIGVLPPLLNL